MESCCDLIELCRDLIELCRDLIELCRAIISTNHSTDNIFAVKFEIGREIIPPNYVMTYFEFYRGNIRNRSRHKSTKLCRGKISNFIPTY